MGENAILVQDMGGWAVLTLNRPERLNALTADMLRQLLDALGELANNDHYRAVLIRGAGRAFCTGQDLNERRGLEGPPDLGKSLETLYNPIVRALRDMPKPVICAVNGVAAGAGANLALACDIVIAAKDAKFLQLFAKIGLCCDSGASHFLPRLVGEARSRGLLMLGEGITGQTAEAWGLIWKAVEPEKLFENAVSIATQLAENPPLGLRLLKQVLNASPHNSLDAQLDLERDAQHQAGRSADYAEAVKAFFEKRAPNFKRS